MKYAAVRERTDRAVMRRTAGSADMSRRKRDHDDRRAAEGGNNQRSDELAEIQHPATAGANVDRNRLPASALDFGSH